MQVTTASFEEVLQRIRPHVHETPVHTSATLNAMTGKQVFLKCELFQRMGAFKMRGATNFITQMSPEERARGVVAVSLVGVLEKGMQADANRVHRHLAANHAC